MKRTLIILITLVGMVTMVHAQQSDTLRFMNNYRQLVSYIDALPVLTKPVADSIIARQDSLMYEYRRLKPQLNNTQVGEYNRLKGRYVRKLLEYRGERVSEGLQQTGDSIAKFANRQGKAIGEFFKGLIEK